MKRAISAAALAAAAMADMQTGLDFPFFIDRSWQEPRSWKRMRGKRRTASAATVARKARRNAARKARRAP